MRSRIRYEGVWYKPVPWIVKGECHGCAMNADTYIHPCFNQAYGEPCSEGYEFEGMVLIRCGKEGLADYIAAKLEG